MKRWTDAIKERLIEQALTPEEQKRINDAALDLNSAGFDRWGLDPETAKVFVSLVRWLHRDYFRVQALASENIPKGRCMIIANHGGQLPVDGILLGLSLLFDSPNPRAARSMVERWVPTLPFVSELFPRLGQIIGDPINARGLLEQEECVVVFPEGTRGLGKPFKDRYHLQRFGSGFMRLAMETQTPIIPVGIVGAEEAYPGLFNISSLAKLLKAPYFPITPFFPFFGPLGAVPLPTKVVISYGEPLYFSGDCNEGEYEIGKKVDQVKRSIETEIARGLKSRGNQIFSFQHSGEKNS